MYATGKYSYTDVAVYLNGKGYKTKYGHPFTYNSIKHVITNKAYLGYIYSRKNDYPPIKADHQPIISQRLFNKVQAIIAERRGKFGRPTAQHRFYLLQGLAYCHHCYKRAKGAKVGRREILTPKMYCQAERWKDTQGKMREYLMYMCRFRRDDKTCKQENVKADIIDKQVLKYMEGFTIPEDIIKMTLDKLKLLFEEAKEADGVQKVVSQLETKRKRINTAFIGGGLSEEEYLERLRKVDSELKQYEGLGLLRGKNTKSWQRECLRLTDKFLRDFRQFWAKLGKEDKRGWIQMTIRKVWVKDKQVVGIEPREEYKPLFVSHRKVLGQSPLVAPVDSIRELQIEDFRLQI